MSTTTATTAGLVEGRRVSGDVLAFLGIPYAAPCSAEGRFLPPRPAVGWTGVRSAVTPGPAAPQLIRPRHGNPEISEDCLVANVWTPSLTGDRPVLVWIHGGGFFTGAGFTPQSDGAALAAHEDVVVVSVNHRLALLGFLHLSELGGADWGFEANPSILDLVAALEWVRDNIGAFGGNPRNVTIFGHSGGGGKVSAVLTSPQASGLFSRAVVHGGPPFGFKDTGRATLIAERALDMLGVRGGDRGALQDLPLERVMQVQSDLGVGAEPTDHGMLFAPVVGTPSVPAFAEEALAAGVAADVPLMTGTAMDEARFIMATQPKWRDPSFDLTEPAVRRIVAAGVDSPDDVETIIERYRSAGASGGSRRLDLVMDILSDQFTIRTARLAQAKLVGGDSVVYSYLCGLNHDTELGSFHGVEMPVFFRNVGHGSIPLSGPAFDRAAPAMSHALASFARTGDPNDAGSADALWPQHTLAHQAQLVFDDNGFAVSDEFLAERRRRWSGVTTTGRQDPWGLAIGESGRA